MAKAVQDIPVLSFKSRKEWSAWLAKQHAKSSGAWLKLAKKGSGLKSVTYDEAVEEALRYGWIDGQKKGFDESAWLQEFTPRGAKSIWSRINRGKAQALIDSGRMKPAGMRAVESARQDGRWDSAYDGARASSVPDDFQAELDAHPKAAAFFAGLDGANRYAILFRLQTAKKEETRRKRIGQFVGMLERGEKIHP